MYGLWTAICIWVLSHYPCFCAASGAVLQQIAALIDELRAEETQVQLNATKNLHRIGTSYNRILRAPKDAYFNFPFLIFVVVALIVEILDCCMVFFLVVLFLEVYNDRIGIAGCCKNIKKIVIPQATELGIRFNILFFVAAHT